MDFLHYTFSSIGGRRINEDSYYLSEYNGGIIAVVADGLGGYSAGKIASKMVISVLQNEVKNNDKIDLTNIVKTANSKILEMQDRSGLKMKTTAAIVLVDSNCTSLLNIGDTRIYLFKNNRIVFQSIDHSVAQIRIMAGELSYDQLRFSKDRNVLTKVLGDNEDIYTSITLIKNETFDSVLICTDGLWEYVYEEEMCSAKAQNDSPSQWINQLIKIRETRAPIENDNYTAIAIIKKQEG